jgi:hypothetical protein
MADFSAFPGGAMSLCVPLSKATRYGGTRPFAPAPEGQSHGGIEGSSQTGRGKDGAACRAVSTRAARADATGSSGSEAATRGRGR